MCHKRSGSMLILNNTTQFSVFETRRNLHFIGTHQMYFIVNIVYKQFLKYLYMRIGEYIVKCQVRIIEDITDGIIFCT